MLDVGQQQFLVLLLMLQPQCDELQQFVLCSLVRACQQIQHARINLSPPGQHLRQRGAADKAPIGARILVANAVVITVEQNAEAGIKGFETRLKPFQHKSFEKPGHMGQMPLGRAGVGHGLKLAVLGAQRLRQPFGLPTNLLKALGQQ